MIQWFFIATILLLPLQFALNVGENIDLVTTKILIPAVFLLWLIKSLARKKLWIPNKVEMWLIMSFLFLSFLSLWGGFDWEKGARKILYLLSIVPVYFVAADLAQDEKFRVKIIRIIWASGTLAAVMGLVQFFLPFVWGLDRTLKIWKNAAVFFLGNSFGKIVATNPSWLVNISGETRMRAFGFFPDPHVFSFFVSLCFFAGLGLMLYEKSNFWKTLIATGNLLMISAVFFSFSRGAYLGVIIGSLFFLIFLLKKKNILGKIVIAGMVALIVALIFYQQAVYRRLVSAFNFKEGSNVERLENWRQAVGMVQDFPFSGVGLGNYASVIDPTAGERSSIYAHNLFLDIAAETGILNAIVFLTLILVGIWRNVISRNILGLGIASGLVYFFIHGIFDTPLWSPQVMVVLLIMLALVNNKLKVQNGKSKVAV
ncbi:MAG: hypothetical protein A3J76_00210 [Candidatus Moranbacteria bacterium RBG_13_45_13]|nr:MAG: hypothetical protein A3J76_00210 [Candidatus Moranbacteria bacterium RBG_13_45_13]